MVEAELRGLTFAFPISEVLVGVTGMGVYWRTINGWKNSRK